MRNIPQPRRQEGPAVTDADLAALLAGTAGAAPGLRPVADLLTALTAPASSAELAGPDRALAEFRRRAGAPAARPRATRLASRLGVKVAAAGIGLALVLGWAATAAFANMLPAPIQRFAHQTIGAPAPPARQGTPGRGQPAVPAAPASGRHPLAHGTPRAGEHPSPHATAPGNPHATAPGNPHGKGGTGNPHARGKHGNPHATGQHGNPQPAKQHGSPHTTAHRAAHPARLAPRKARHNLK